MEASSRHLKKKYNSVSHNNEILSHNNDLFSRNNEKLSRNNDLTLLQKKKRLPLRMRNAIVTAS